MITGGLPGIGASLVSQKEIERDRGKPLSKWVQYIFTRELCIHFNLNLNRLISAQVRAEHHDLRLAAHAGRDGDGGRGGRGRWEGDWAGEIEATTLVWSDERRKLWWKKRRTSAAATAVVWQWARDWWDLDVDNNCVIWNIQLKDNSTQLQVLWPGKPQTDKALKLWGYW